MKTKTIFKTLALAMMMPAMLLTTACSNDDDVVNTSNITSKGYALPVTVSATRGDGATRASYNESTRKLEFSTGDKLFVSGYYDGDYEYEFAGELDYVPATEKFSGTIYTSKEWTGTADVLFTAASANGYVYATLLPAGYGSYGFLTIEDYDIEEKYDDFISSNNTYTLATSKAAGVEQFSYEKATEYDNGFTLSPNNAILNFTITGLAASTSVNVSLTSYAYNITGTVTTDSSGNATFAIGLEDGSDLNDLSLTVAGNPVTLVNSSTELTAGKIYNITRAVTPPTLADVFTEGAEVNVKVNTANGYWFNAAGTYSSGSYTGVTQTTNLDEGFNKGISMTKDGNNLVVWMKNSYNEITITFNTTNNIYTVTAGESAAVYRMTTFNSMIINGVDITSLLSEPPMETITFSSGSGTWNPDTGEALFTGTHFNVAGSSYDDFSAYFYVNKFNHNMEISATDGKTITKVVFNYNWNGNLGSLAFTSGTFDGNATVNNVNASTLTVTSSHAAGTKFSGVTIYYE